MNFEDAVSVAEDTYIGKTREGDSCLFVFGVGIGIEEAGEEESAKEIVDAFHRLLAAIQTIAWK